MEMLNRARSFYLGRLDAQGRSELPHPPAGMQMHKALQSWSCWYMASAEKLAELQALSKHLRKLFETKAGSRAQKAFQKLFAFNQKKANQLISGKQGQHGITALRSTPSELVTSQTGLLEVGWSPLKQGSLKWHTLTSSNKQLPQHRLRPYANPHGRMRIWMASSWWQNSKDQGQSILILQP